MITLVSVPGTGGAPIFESFPVTTPAPGTGSLTDPWLPARGQMLGKPQGLNWFWFLVTYPAAVFPMGPSWRQGIEIVVYVLLNPRQFGIPCWQDANGRWVFRHVLDGYSQGAIVVARVWRDEILNPNGRLHHLLPYCLGTITYGPPLRAPGIAYGNTEICGLPVPPPVDGLITGGIAGPDDLTPAQCLFPDGHPLAGQPAVYDHCAVGDLYGDCPVGDNPWTAISSVGHDENLIYDIIQDFTGSNILAIAKAVIPLLNPAQDVAQVIAELPALIAGLINTGGITALPTNPSNAQIVGFIEALLNGGLFLIQGAGPHGNYNAAPAQAWLEELGKQYA